MKVFISHKKEDADIAFEVLNSLKSYGVDAYLDLLEGNLVLKGEELTRHIRKRLNECTDLLVVISEKTKYSWWVPFEVGMSAQKDFPTVNYLKAGVDLPSYLEYWPRLKDTNDLKKYVDTKTIVQKSLTETFEIAESSTEMFYKELKAKL